MQGWGGGRSSNILIETGSNWCYGRNGLHVTSCKFHNFPFHKHKVTLFYTGVVFELAKWFYAQSSFVKLPTTELYQEIFVALSSQLTRPASLIFSLCLPLSYEWLPDLYLGLIQWDRSDAGSLQHISASSHVSICWEQPWWRWCFPAVHWWLHLLFCVFYDKPKLLSCVKVCYCEFSLLSAFLA